jgi:hypothetical protein
MKKFINIAITFSLLIFFQNKLWSQQQGSWKFTPSYSVAVPVGDFKNLVSETSIRGWNAEAMYGITDQVSLGVSGGFQDFYQRYPREVLHGGGSDISAVITNSVQVIPIMLKGRYFISNEGVLQPFASLAAGGNIIQYQKYYGQFVEGKTKFGFAAQPEIGAYVPLGAMKRIGLNISGAYNIMPFKYNDANGLSNIAFKAGLSIPLQR